MADVLQRLRTRILPVTSPASVERILGPNAANLVFFGVVERETTSLFRSRKKVLLVISYTSIFWFDVDTGCPLRMIKIRELASPLTLNNAGFGSVVLRVAGENDALLHFVDSSKQGELSTPDVSTVDNFVAKLKQLHRIFVPDKELEVEKVDLKPEELKKAKAAIGKIKGQPSTMDKILQLKAKADEVQREHRQRVLAEEAAAAEAKRAAEEAAEAQRLLDEKAAAEAERRQKESEAEAERVRQRLREEEEAEELRSRRATVWRTEEGNDMDGGGLLGDERLRGSAAVAAGGGAVLSDLELYRTEDSRALSLAGKEEEGGSGESALVRGLRANLAALLAAQDETRRQVEKASAENAAMTQTKALLEAIVADLRTKLNKAHAEREVGLVGDALQEQQLQIATATRIVENGEHESTRLRGDLHLVLTDVERLESAVAQLEADDERERGVSVELVTSGFKSAVDGAKEDDDADTEEREMSSAVAKLRDELHALEAVISRRAAVEDQLRVTERDLRDAESKSEELRKQLENKKREALEPMKAAFAASLAELNASYDSVVQQRIEKEWADECKARAGDAAAVTNVLASRIEQEKALSERVAEIANELNAACERRDAAEVENASLRQIHSALVTSQLQLTDAAERFSRQLSQLSAQLDAERKGKVRLIEARVAAIENGFTQTLLTQQDELERLRGEIAVMMETVGVAQKLAAQAPSLKRQLALDL